LVFAILVLQGFNQLREELLDIFDEKATGIPEVRIVRVEHVCSEQGPEVDDKLFRGWHVALAKGTYHLVGVQLLVNGTLQAAAQARSVRSSIHERAPRR
jgi:hypothetical protein